jgi:antitoxin component YwqK of YwqJK toxin-antitoxin module
MKRLFFITLLLPCLLTAPAVRACVCLPLPPLDKLSQLEQYSFIALVVITDDGDIPADRFKDSGVLKFNILRQFKGQPVGQLIEYAKNSSCDLGISAGEEWLLFGSLAAGELHIQACERNVMYRNKSGERDWMSREGIDALDKLTELYRLPVPSFRDGVHTVLYKNGQKELEENYLQNKLQGDRKVWYANGRLRISEHFVNGLPDGKSEWWFPSGQLFRESYFRAGKNYNVSRFYYDTTLLPGMKRMLVPMIYATEDSLVNEFHRIQVHYESVYDNDGNAIIRREYYQSGVIKSESTDGENKEGVRITYYTNGRMQTLTHTYNNKQRGLYHEYKENGELKRSGVNDEKGDLKWNHP